MLHRAAAFAALLVLVGCVTDTATAPYVPPPVTGLSVNPVSLLAGDSISPGVQVTVGGETRAATPSEIRVTSSDTNVIMIALNNALVAVGDGQADITIAWIRTPSISVTRTVTITSEILDAVQLLAPLGMVPGDSGVFAVTGTIRDGHTVAHPASVTVSSRNPAVVSTSGGIAIANAAGQAWIVATAASGVGDSVLVTVAPGAPVRLTMTPESASLVAGQSLHLALMSMFDRHGNAIANVTPTFTSTSSAVATVQLDGTVTGVAAGSVMIVAAAGIGADTLRLTVTAPPPTFQRLTVTPDSVTLHPGDTAHVVVKAFDSQGNPMALPTLTWQSQTGGITVSSTGLMQAASSITTGIPNGVVKVSSGTVSAQVRVAVVIAVPVLARLVVSPDSVTLNPGGSAQISVQAIDTRGAAMAVPALTWQSLTSGVSVSGAGLITASSGIGSTISNGVVQASGGGIAVQVRVAVVVIVVPPPPPPPLPPPPMSDAGYVQIRWVGTLPSAAVVAAFEAARVRINSLFNSFNGVAPISLNLPAGACQSGSPALAETVNGIIIFAQVTTIDGVGGILGSAGPCIARQVTWIPIVGAMQFDVADMTSMAANGTLNGVVLHEMMHTLGFGTIWGPGLLGEVAAPSGADPRYLGGAGQSAYAAVGGLDASIGVPVENTGGSGTRGSHWRESIFRTELMTGWADGSLPMSRVTIGVLKDFGYDVDLNKADPFTLPTSPPGAGLRASQQIVEQTITPIGMVDRNGQITPYSGPVVH